MANTKDLYTGDGTTKTFAVNFPFLSPSHVEVFVNDTKMLDPMHYTLSGSTVSFDDAPEIDAAIVIKRVSSPNNTLVDFTDGSVLNEQALDTAYLHNYYLYQEAVEDFNQLINEALVKIASGTGITETETPAVIAALVNELLNDSAAADLQQRVNDIDANGEAIVSLGENLQVQINTLAGATAATVFVQAAEPVPGVGGVPDPIPEGARWYDSDDNNKPYIYQAGAWISIEDPRIGQAVADITVLQTDVAGNAAAIVTESLARSTGDSALATTLSLLGAENGAQTAFILDTNTVKIDTDTGDTFATRLSNLTAADNTNAANIASEITARTNADSAIASDVTALTARVTDAETDIATNAASIVTEQSARASGDAANASSITAVDARVDLRPRVFFQTTAPTAERVGDLWIRSSDNVMHRWSGSSWNAIPDAAIGGNASAITALDSRVTTNESGISSQASQITTLQSDVVTVDGRVDSANVTIAANTSAISTAQGDITSLEAKYGVRLDVNGYVTGFILNNDGAQGNFVIMADRFAVIEPGSTTGSGTIPFLIESGTVKMQNVEINGNLLLNGSVAGASLINGTVGATQIGANAITTDKLNANSITADKIQANAVTAAKISVTDLAAITADLGSITAGNITLDSADGYIKGGATAFDTGNGFWLGYDTSAWKFFVGNRSTAQYMEWDGTTLTVRGDFETGEYVADATNILLAANTSRTILSVGSSFTEVKKFTMGKGGTVRVQADHRRGSFSGTQTQAAQMRVKKNGVVQTTWTATSTTNTTRILTSLSVTADDVITFEHRGGMYNDGAEILEFSHTILNAQIRGELVLTDGGTVNTD